MYTNDSLLVSLGATIALLVVIVAAAILILGSSVVVGLPY
jgi:hypothetical protein